MDWPSDEGSRPRSLLLSRSQFRIPNVNNLCVGSVYTGLCSNSNWVLLTKGGFGPRPDTEFKKKVKVSIFQTTSTKMTLISHLRNTAFAYKLISFNQRYSIWESNLAFYKYGTKLLHQQFLENKILFTSKLLWNTDTDTSTPIVI